MDEREREALREEAGLGGEYGENVVVAEYDVGGQERRHGERRQGDRREGAQGQGKPMFVRTAEGEKVKVNGAVGLARGEKTKVNGAAAVATGNRTKLTGWAEVVAARNDVRIKKGATALALAGRELELKDHGYAGVVLAPKVEVKDGGRILVSTLGALLGGAAIGIGWGLVAFASVWFTRRQGLLGRMRARRMMRTGALGTVMGAERRAMTAVRGALQR